jgi:hypothetical protein
MKKLAVVMLALVLVLSLAAGPSEAWGRGGHFHGHGCCWGGWWLPGAILGGLALGAVVAATAPPYYAAPPAVAYAPAPTYVAPAPAPPAVQREVVYPNGRYVLYGDGVRQPWQWVWVPAAPPPPPPPAR